ncbi:predicted protein [Uncinocarpus reesii 1704]|uniref:Uncharacterized protein n=1 Tax=Uncinocarpus reesii (strain UAMH 1704) TaxID=336963 RepID=C4JSE2_UNCRE|nr:uncharacterized protein UREG_05381 [Uncinocarpus reesii 1704]EEP80539.1 predicted protein [Uncinocarpus reesii 1704]
MFEGFSFPSPSSGDSLCVPGNRDDEGFLHCESNLVSPLSSRCPSPRLGPRDYSARITKRSRSPFRRGPAPTSMPPGYVDRHRLSIGSLTRKLDSQSLEHNDLSSDSDDSRGYPITPRTGYLEPNASANWMDRKPSIAFISPQYGEKRDGYATSPFDISPTSTPRSSWDRRYSHPVNHTSTPNTSSPRHGSIEASKHRQSVSALRSQREKLSILQCASTSVADTIRLAQIIDEDERFRHYTDDNVNNEQHPSSLPPSRTPSRRQHKKPDLTKASGGSILSAASAGKSKVDKSYGHSDRRSGRPGQTGLRRKSLVLAAVTAVLESESAGNHRDSATDPPASDQLQSLENKRPLPLSQLALA